MSPKSIAVGVTLGLVVVAVGRLLLFGWAGVAPDDARYLFVGLSVLDGHGPLTPSGNPFLLRSPVYGLTLAGGAAILPDGPIDGGRIVAATLTILGFVGAVRLGWLFGGGVGAAATALALMAMPLLWRLLPTLRVDLPQTAGVVAVLLALHRPTTRRWVLGGALFGLTILVKETILPLALAPLAFAGSVPRRRLGRLWAAFLATAIVVAGWWWVVVWTQSGAIFPLNAVGVIERRDVGSDIRPDLFGGGLVVVILAAWIVVAGGARRDRGLRLLTAAGLCLAPAALYATANGLNTRNYAGLAVLSAIAIGVAAARILRWPAATTGRAAPGRVAVLGLGLVVGLIGGGLGQARSGDPSEPVLPGQIAAYLRSATPIGGRVVMTFRYSEVVALELYGAIGVPGLAPVRVDPATPLSDFVWIGLRDRQLFGYTRSTWEHTLGEPATTGLVLAGPHPLTPAELVPALGRGEVPGLMPDRRLETPDEWAAIYGVTPAAVRTDPSSLRLTLSPAAAIAWLDLVGGETGAADLANSGAIAVGPGHDALASRLRATGCLVGEPDRPETARILPLGSACAGG